MPEGRIPLAEAVVLPRDRAEVERRVHRHRRARSPTCAPAGSGACPKHLRDAHYPGAKRLGHGKGYLYPHDAESASSRSSTCPTSCVGTEYYEPTEHGNEREVAARLEKIRAILRGE